MHPVWLSLLLNRYVLGLVGVVALSVAGYFAWQHYVAAPYRAQGREEMRPLLEKQSAQLEADIKAFAAIEASMVAIKQNSEKLKQQVARATSINAERNKAEATRVAIIEAIAPTGATECERTDDVITKALR